MPLVLGGSAAIGGFTVDNSCLFDGSGKLGKTLGTPTDLNMWTWSAWVKLGAPGALGYTFECTTGASNFTAVKIDSTSRFFFGNYDSGYLGQRDSTRLLRDPAAWYHLVALWDSDNGTPADRMKLYVNGVELSSWHGTTNPTSGEACQMASGAELWVGVHQTVNDYFQGYMAEVCFIDGQALAPTSFAEYDEDSPSIWKPKDVSGLTFGNNGFYLDFKDSANLGNDANGGTDLTETNIAAIDQGIDSPTNNFCVMNPIVGDRSGYTWSYGNTKLVTGNNDGSGSTMGTPSGKWYYEIYIDTLGNFYGGWQDLNNIEADFAEFVPAGCVAMNNTPDIYYNGTGTAQSSGNKGVNSFTSGDYIGLAFDTDNLTCWWSKTGQWYTGDSGTASTLTRAQVSANANGFDCTTAAAFSSSSVVAPFMGCSTSSTTNSYNFGNGRFGGTALTGTTYSDNNSQGIFKYEPPDGFRALCTKNLGEFG